MIVLGAVIFISSSMISTMIWPDQLKDEEASKRDFITYNIRSITWYAFNTILIGIPSSLLLLDYTSPRNDNDGTNDYWYLMVTLVVIHFVQFMFIRELMTIKPRG